jgi:molybdenum cofactor cytidylyltransferase
VRAQRLTTADVGRSAPADLAGAVLLAAARLPERTLPKGTRLDRETAGRLIAAATDGTLAGPLRLAWPDPDDVHEDDAASRLALVVGGAGVEPRTARQSRLDLAAAWDGVLHVRTEALRRLNAIDPLEVFTLFHGQAVRRGQVVCSVKVAPHVLPGATLTEGLRLARAEGPIVEVRPYRPTEVGAIAVEAMTADALARFEASARAKVEALGGTFAGTIVVPDGEPDRAEAGVRDALEVLVRRRGLPVVLVGGVSAGDPLSSFYPALERLGGTVLRRGVPAHPGSMIWLARLDRTQLLGLPQCGMFSLATAADLVLPRLFTGEALTAESLADLAHGGLLGREMRFRMPAYASDLPAPEEG